MNTLTRSPADGCVTVAVTRHEPSDGSIAAESIVVFGSEILARFSHGHTGVVSGKSGFGGASAARINAIAPRSATRKKKVRLFRKGWPAKSIGFMSRVCY